MKLRIWLLLSLLASGITCLYAIRVLTPWEYYVDVEHGNLKARMDDLYSPWVGTRELLLRGRNPYGPEVSHEIQMAFYGHVLNQAYGKAGVEVLNEQRFAYPVYVVFLLAPTAYMDFSRLQVLASVSFVILTAISVLIWLDVLCWKPPRTLVAAILLFVLSSPQIMQGLRLRQMGMVVGFLLALSAWCITRDRLAIAGVMLALSTVKPQMALLPLAWFLLWGASNWPKRWPLLAAFGVTLIGLVGLGELILPGWHRYFLDGLSAYRQYSPSPSLLCIALGDWMGRAISGIVILGLLVLALRNREKDATAPEFIQTLAAIFIGTTIVLPLLAPFNQVILLLPTMMVVRNWAILPRFGRRLFAFMVAWPWITSAILLLLVHPRLDSPSRLPLLQSAMALFVPFLLAWLSTTIRGETGRLLSPRRDAASVRL
jgi:hypothetical protein